MKQKFAFSPFLCLDTHKNKINVFPIHFHREGNRQVTKRVLFILKAYKGVSTGSRTLKRWWCCCCCCWRWWWWHRWQLCFTPSQLVWLSHGDSENHNHHHNLQSKSESTHHHHHHHQHHDYYADILQHLSEAHLQNLTAKMKICGSKRDRNQ